jgi:hypothetical protein
MGVGLSSAVYLNINSDTAKERLAKRAEEEDREDDKDEEIIKQRFKEFKEKTVPIIDFYKSSRKLKDIKSGVPHEEVYQRVVNSLGLVSKKDEEESARLCCTKRRNRKVRCFFKSIPHISFRAKDRNSGFNPV